MTGFLVTKYIDTQRDWTEQTEKMDRVDRLAANRQSD